MLSNKKNKNKHKYEQGCFVFTLDNQNNFIFNVFKLKMNRNEHISLTIRISLKMRSVTLLGRGCHCSPCWPVALHQGKCLTPKNARRGNSRRGDAASSHKLWWRLNKCHEFRSSLPLPRPYPATTKRASLLSFLCILLQILTHGKLHSSPWRESFAGHEQLHIAGCSMKYLFTPNPHTFSYIKNTSQC